MGCLAVEIGLIMKLRGEWGFAAVEYAVFLGFISLMVVVALTALGQAINGVLQYLADVFASAG